MSVKCSYSSIYYPLLRSQLLTDPNGFKNFINDHFINPDEVYRMFVSGVNTNSTPTPTFEIQAVSSRMGIQFPQEVVSPQQYYIGNARQYNRMIDNAAKRLIALSVFDINTDSFIDANAIVGSYSNLNNGIFKYKLELLSNLSSFMGKTLPEINVTTDPNQIIQTFEDTISNYEAYIRNSDLTQDQNYFNAFNSYVTLTSFDDIIKLYTPFISIKPEFRKSSIYSIDRYIYDGPNVTHYTGFSNNEFMGSEESVSDLAKILLSYFPEVNSDGDIINNTSISLSGFNSTLSKVKLFIEESLDPEIISEAKKGANANLNIIIDKYLQALNNKSLPTEHITYLQNKLRGIQRFIYSDNMSTPIKQMFTNLMFKTVLSSYISYSSDPISGNLTGRNLTDRPISIERFGIVDVVRAASTYWTGNKLKFNELLDKHNIEISGSVISIKSGLNTLVLKYDNESGKFTTTGNIDEISLEKLLVDFTSMIIPDDFNQVVEQVFPRDLTKNKISLFAPILGTVLLGADRKTTLDTNKKGFFGQSRDLSKVLSVINGSDTINVIKNAEGNNLPLYQMVCLAYSHKGVKQYLDDQLGWGADNVIIDNGVYQNIQHVKSPKIRAEVTIGNFTKQSKDLTENEVQHLAIVYDFLEGLTKNKSASEGEGSTAGIIGLQTTVYSDKNKHFVMQFDLNQDWNFGDLGNLNFKEVLNKFFKSQNFDDLEPIKNIWFETNKRQYNNLVNRIISDYQTASKKNIQTLSDLKDYIKKTPVKHIRTLFRNAGLEFIDEVHISKSPAKTFVFNETLEFLYNTFNNRDQFNQFLNKQLNRFLEDSAGAWESISTDQTAIKAFIDQGWDPWILKETRTVRDSEGHETTEEYSKLLPFTVGEKGRKLNPLLASYFIMDSFLSNEYNKMMVGGVYAHPNKNKEAVTSTEYVNHSFATRWISQVKRMVIYGATHHPFAQGLKNGVAEKVKMAVIADIGSSVQNISGLEDSVDSMDGAGFTSPYFSRQQNVSLIDAKVGKNKKTIFADINGQYGLPKLLKWAEYEITNSVRRLSWGSTVKMENMFRKMHSLSFGDTVSVNYNNDFDNVFYQDPSNGVYWKINRVAINNNLAEIEKVEVNEIGTIVGNPVIESNIVIDSIYSLDQLFGGAWSMEYSDLTKSLIYSENSLDLVNDIVNDKNLKEYFIGYLVNKSAIKVGASNINDVDSWNNSEPLWYTDLSTKFGGVQMDADHELDEAEVTEMTQMISALEQMGYTHNLASRVYQEIGKLCYDAIAEVTNILENNDVQGLYEIYGKALVKAFQTNNKDTLGLAQSFIKLAQQGFNEKNIDYKIPFSSGTINGIFNSTVTSSLVKDAIRRHYSGVASVLNPSYDSIQYYQYGGNTYTYPDLLKLINRVRKESGQLSLTVKSALNDVMIEDFLNPFIVDLTPDDPIDFEDTLVVYNNQSTDEFGNTIYTNHLGEVVPNAYEIVKIDNYQKYDWFKHHDSRYIQKWTIKPKNLKGSDTTFEVNGQKFSVFEGDISRVLHYLEKTGSTDIVSLEDEIKHNVRKELGFSNELTDIQQSILDNVYTERMSMIHRIIDPFVPENGKIRGKFLKNRLVREQQKLLNALADGKPIIWQGAQVQPENVTVVPAQIIMGKLYAKQLGLLPGDSIAQIKEEGPQFFENRIQGYYNDNNSDNEAYDAVLFDGTGDRLYVKVGNPQTTEFYKDSLTPNSEFTIVDNRVYYNGNDIGSADGKSFYTYTDTSGEKHNFVIVDHVDRLSELRNSGIYNNYKYNYTESNLDMLLNVQFNSELTNNTPITLSYYDDFGEVKTRPIININTINTLTLRQMLDDNQAIRFTNRIKRIAETKYQTFLKSLKFVGTRIPCQSMQSFMPLEIVAFTDSDINEVYVPTNQTWLQGSDFDIDKLYILGYSVSDNGSINYNTEVAPYLKQDALRNRVVDGIFDVILNPRNQINLTMPITTSNIGKLAEKSILGQASLQMSPFNPSSKYLMQIQNMVGKTVIGNVATGSKSFFALSNVYNTRFREIAEHLNNGDYESARSLLSKYIFKHPTEERFITLANVDMEVFDDIQWLNIPEDIRVVLESIIEFQESLSDKSLDLGELLNASTDNAKELILKKINADANWVDIYVYSLMIGDDLETIGKLMLTPQVTELVSNYSTNLWLDPFPKDKLKYIEYAANHPSEFTPEGSEISKTTELFFQLLERAKGAEEIRILGRLLKINQGIPTDKYGKYSYIKGIEAFISKKAEKSFDLLRFIKSSTYREEWINLYEKVKTTFNILDVISTVPHFKEMFNIINVDDEVLNTLSVRNKVESLVIPEFQNEKGSKLNAQEFRQAKNAVNDFIINSWITSKNISFKVPLGQRYETEGATLLNDTPGFTINLDSNLNIESFRYYMEDYVIPTLKEKLPNNSFIKGLTFGLKTDPTTGKERGFFKPIINMMQVDNTQKTKAIYEQMLHDFNDLNKISIAEIDNQNPVNLFYLYNLIINKDGFGQASMTRFFEDLVASGDNSLLVVDYNNWIDNQDPYILTDQFFNNFYKSEGWDSESFYKVHNRINPANENVETIGFKSEENTSLDEDYNDRQSNEESIQSNELPNTSTQEDTEYYDTKPSTKALLIDLLDNQFKDLNIIKVTNDDLTNEDASIRNAKGFIKDGQIYINIDKATRDTVIHEFAHLYLAAAKMGENSQTYYEILSELPQTAIWKEMRENKYYINKRGSDFDEEVLATIISRYVSRADKPNKRIMNKVVEILPFEFVALLSGLASDFKPDLEFLASNYKTSQKMATVKNQLIEDNILKEDCK